MKLKTKLQYCLLGCTVFLSSRVNAQKTLHKTVIKNMSELQAFFHYEDDKPVIVSGHRGGLLPGYAENSIEAMQQTLSLMPSFFEIDPRFTKDSVIVLMHDDNLARVSDLKGKVSEHTYDEIKNVRLKDRQGNLTNSRIPTLQQALDWGKEKTIFNLDNKNIPWSKYVELFKGNKYPNLILSVRSMKEASYYYERLDNVLLCIAIKSPADLAAFQETKIPYNLMIAYVGDSISSNNDMQVVIQFLHHKGVMCFYSFPPTFDKLKTNELRMNAYMKELIKRPDIIETDYPALFSGKSY